VNREIVRDRKAEYRRKNRERLKAKDAAYYAANREKFAAYARAYLRANPETFRACAARRRGRNKGALGEHTAAEWIGKKQDFGNRCADCGIKEGTRAPNGKAMKLTRGHAVPLCKGGSNSIINIIPQCLRCNLRQGRNIHPSVIAFSLFDRFIA
jgi:5-methylcytosine-specific restriction endonuclease McrA